MRSRVHISPLLSAVCLLATACATQQVQIPKEAQRVDAEPVVREQAARRTQVDMVNKLAPDFLLSDLDGNELRLSDFKGKTLILNFWATWCTPCRRGIPQFMALHEKYHDRGFMMLGLCVDRRNPNAARVLAEANRINYPVLRATDEVQDAYGYIPNVPTSFLIDGAGIVCAQYVGYHEQAVYEDDVRALLGLKQE